MSQESGQQAESNEFDTLFHKEIYTPEEAAELASCSIDRIYEAAHAGRLKALIIGQDVVSIKRSDLVAWMTER
jgi:excisionase family DNA binding protein